MLAFQDPILRSGPNTRSQKFFHDLPMESLDRADGDTLQSPTFGTLVERSHSPSPQAQKPEYTNQNLRESSLGRKDRMPSTKSTSMPLLPRLENKRIEQENSDVQKQNFIKNPKKNMKMLGENLQTFGDNLWKGKSRSTVNSRREHSRQFEFPKQDQELLFHALQKIGVRRNRSQSKEEAKTLHQSNHSISSLKINVSDKVLMNKREFSRVFSLNQIPNTVNNNLHQHQPRTETSEFDIQPEATPFNPAETFNGKMSKTEESPGKFILPTVMAEPIRTFPSILKGSFSTKQPSSHTNLSSLYQEPKHKHLENRRLRTNTPAIRVQFAEMAQNELKPSSSYFAFPAKRNPLQNQEYLSVKNLINGEKRQPLFSGIRHAFTFPEGPQVKIPDAEVKRHQRFASEARDKQIMIVDDLQPLAEVRTPNKPRLKFRFKNQEAVVDKLFNIQRRSQTEQNDSQLI